MNLNELLAANPNPKIVHVVKDVKGHKGPEKGFQFSASQVDTYRDCPRKWAFDKIDRVPRVTHESAKLGSDVHDLREKWLRDGILPDGDDYASLCARAGIEHLPMPGVATVEGQVIKKAPHVSKDAFWIGYIDFFIGDQGVAGYYPPERSDWPSVDGVPLVGDHKTTANKSYIKTIDYLLDEDPQGAMYAMYAMDRMGASHVDLFWHFIVKTKKPRPVPVRVRATRPRIEASYEKVLIDAGTMKNIFETPGIKAMDVEPDPTACDMYGGCPHRNSGRCQLTMTQKIGALKMGTGDLEAKLLAQMGGEPAPTTETLPASGVAQPTAAPSNGEGGLAALQSAMQTGVVVEMPTQAPTRVAPAQPGALAAMLTGDEPPSNPAPTQTVAEAAKSLSEAEKIAQAAIPPPPVTPPDAPEADLNAELPAEDKKTKKASSSKRQTAADKRREAIAAQVLAGLAAHYKDMGVAVERAVELADALIAELDA